MISWVPFVEQKTNCTFIKVKGQSLCYKMFLWKGNRKINFRLIKRGVLNPQFWNSCVLFTKGKDAPNVDVILKRNVFRQWRDSWQWLRNTVMGNCTWSLLRLSLMCVVFYILLKLWKINWYKKDLPRPATLPFKTLAQCTHWRDGGVR